MQGSILVIEQDPATRELVTANLRQAGYSVSWRPARPKPKSSLAWGDQSFVEERTAGADLSREPSAQALGAA